MRRGGSAARGLAAAALLSWSASRVAAAPPSWDLLQSAATATSAVRPVEIRALHGEYRPAISLAVPDGVEYPIAIPADATLELGYAVHAIRGAVTAPEAVGPTRVRFTLVASDGGRTVLHERVVDARARESDRRWLDAQVDLRPFAGRTGRLAIDVASLDDTPGPEPASVLLSAARVLQPAGPDEPNVLLLTIDCLRADHVGSYGYARPTTPAIDRLATEGVRFAHAYANAPMTIPSLPQLYTSQLFPLPADATFVNALATAGVPSAAIVNNTWLTLWLAVVRAAAPDRLDRLVAADDANAAGLTDQAMAWIDARGDRRWALHVHYLDAHSPYVLFPSSADRFGDPAYRGPVTRTFDDLAGARHGLYDDADRARVTSLYDAGIRFADDQIGRLLDRLREAGRLDRTVVLVTADHGEELWEHGAFFHGQSLYDELLHVPLVVRLPGAASAGTVVDRAVQLLDVAPSLLDWAGLPVPASLAGRPLREAIAAAGAPGPAIVATATNPQFPTRYAVRTPTHKLIEHLASARAALFDLRSDAAERHDLAPAAPFAELAATLATARAPLARRGLQVRVVTGPGARHRVALRFDDASEDRFGTLDRVGAAGAVRLALTRLGRGARAKGVVGRDGVGFRFDRLTRPFLAAWAPDRLRLAGQVDGTTLADAAVALGAAGYAPRDGFFDARDRRLVSTTPPACVPPERGVKVCLWRADDGASGGAPAPDPATRERLRGLGYAQ